MATTASCAQVIPFPQVRQSQPAPPAPPYGVRDNEYYGYNYNNIRARAREIVGMDARQVALAQVSQAFEACLGRLPTRYIIDQIADYLDQGIDPAMIVAVLEYSTGAPRPSWAYAQAVIARNAAQGVTTAAAFAAALNSYRDKAAKRAQEGGYGPGHGKKSVIEQQYCQREYADDEWGGMSAKDIEEARKL